MTEFLVCFHLAFILCLQRLILTSTCSPAASRPTSAQCPTSSPASGSHLDPDGKAPFWFPWALFGVPYRLSPCASKVYAIRNQDSSVGVGT
ncbi:hypothetical protein C8R44DRAFT_764181 [Mycena epipterygia]|nr:hypothetical protein C8R44DRAFT_764181 [Mycena epipterygia]